MSTFDVKPDRIESFADMLERQANAIEKSSAAVKSLGQNLSQIGSSTSAMKKKISLAGDAVHNDANLAKSMVKALRDIARTYRKYERSIIDNIKLGNVQIPGNSNGGNNSTGGNGGNTGNGGSSTQNGNNTNSGAYSTDPVNLNTGNFILDNHDIELPGYKPIVFSRFYNSVANFSGMLGRDWNTCFEMKLYKANALDTEYKAFIMLGDGREEYFSTKDGVIFEPETSTTAELTRNEDGSYVYKTIDGDCFCFDELGVYTRYEDLHHVGFSLEYDDGKLIKVAKDSGEYFSFNYAEDGLLEYIEDHVGRKCLYRFTNGHLTEVELPDGGKYQYAYSETGKICNVINPRSVNAVETSYDDLHRVIFQRFADGTTNTFEYLDSENAVVMTERNGSKSIHYHNEKFQNVKNVYSNGEEIFEYNARGQKKRIVDRAGNVTNLQYDDRGNVTGIISSDGTKSFTTYNAANQLLTLSVNGICRIRNQYNKLGELVSTIDANGNKTSYKYNENGQVIEMVYPNGDVASTEYDDFGNIKSIVYPNGGKVSFEYDRLNQMIKKTDALGHTTAYEYDVMGRITCETRPDGNSHKYVYDAWGNIIEETDFDGSKICRVFNENNKPIEITDALGRKVSFKYDSMWNVAEAVLPNGASFKYLYDENNNLQTEIDAENNATKYEYDSLGNVISITNAEGSVVRYTWDSIGRCVQMVNADGAATLFGYDAYDHMIYVKDAEGTELFRTYDVEGQLISEKDSLGKERFYEYDSVGNLIKITDEFGLVTTYEYAQGSDKVSKVEYPDGTTECYAYDYNGNVSVQTDAYGQTLSYEYDELDRITKISNKDGLVCAYEYDPMGRIVSETNNEGSATKYEYSKTGQLVKHTNPLGNVTEYSYDEMDGLIEITKANPDSEEQSRILYERNRMGQITKVTDALGMVETYQYNKIGKMLEKVDRDNYRTRYEYNSVGLLSRVAWDNGKEVTYGYTPLRRLSQISDWTGTTKVAYDAYGKPLQVEYPDNGLLQYEYDAKGNLIHLLYPSGKEISYEHDELNRITNILQGGSRISYTYDEHGKISARTLPDGSVVNYTYGEDGLLKKMCHTNGSEIMDSFEYEYDAYGRKISQKQYHSDYAKDNGFYEYSYDSIGRISKVLRNAQVARAYSYDALGNRKSSYSYDFESGTARNTEYTYDLRGAVTKAVSEESVEEYTYDQRGNLIGFILNGQLSTSYKYDEMNRLAAASTVDGDSSEYEYNGLGYLCGKLLHHNGITRSVSYRVDYNRIYNNKIEETEDGRVKSFVWGSALEGYTDTDNSCGWYTLDSLGSVIRKSNTESTTFIGSYDEFGNNSLINDVCDGEFGYNGFVFDAATGAYFAQARMYRSKLGTFDAMDRIGGDITSPDTINPYIYCIHDPLNRTDKSGYWFGIDDAIAAGVGAIGGLVSQGIGDAIQFVTEGKIDSGWQDYVGAAVGGAAGGVTTLYAGPIAGGAVAGGVSKLSTEGLKYVSDPKGYTKSGWDVFKETAFETLWGAASAGVSKLIGKGVQKVANTKVVSNIASKLSGGGKIASFFGNYIDDIAKGRSHNILSQAEKILKNQHAAIKASDALKKKMTSLMLKNIPKYVGQEVLDKIVGKIKPVKAITGQAMKWLKGKAKGLFGIGVEKDPCAAAA